MALTTENTVLLLLRAFASVGMFTEPLPSNELFLLSGVMSQYVLNTQITADVGQRMEKE
jgi:hypothetical protein